MGWKWNLKSTSGYFTLVGGNFVTWKGKKQSVISLLSVVTKFRVITLGLCETLCLKLLLQDFGYLSSHQSNYFMII